MARCACHLVGLLLLFATCLEAAELKCPERHGSPGRELVCYTKTTEAKLLENAICHCTTLVHQGHDLQNYDATGVKNLRDRARKVNPNLKVVLSVSDEYGVLANSATNKEEAIQQMINILKQVDGIELNVSAGEKDRLVSFVKALKEEMINESLEKVLIIALPTKPEHLAKRYELKELAKYADFFSIATDYLRDNDEAYRAFHPSRLMGLFDMLNTDSLVDLISGMGAPKQKILITAPAEAYKFTLRDAKDNTPRSLTMEEQPVSIDRQKLCFALNKGQWIVERDEDLTAPYAFKNTEWIAFEDETSLKIKGKYVILRDLAGLGLINVEKDLKNECGGMLVQTLNEAFSQMKRKTRDVILSSLENDLKGHEIAYPRHVRSSDFRIARVIDTEGKIRTVREHTQTFFVCTRQGYFVHPKGCNRFYRCVKFNQGIDEYSVFEFNCPAGLAFDEKTETCAWPGSLSKGSACPGSSEIEPVSHGRFQCPGKGFYADPHNCRWFFACYDLGGPQMIPYEFRCPFGLVFDQHRLVCEWPWKVPHCFGPGHGDGHQVYNFGNSVPHTSGSIPSGGIVGQGGFAGPGSYNELSNFGEDFDYGTIAVQNLSPASEMDYNTPEVFGAGMEYEKQSDPSALNSKGQNYNPSNFAMDYDNQNYDQGKYNYDGQFYNKEKLPTVYNTQSYGSGNENYDFNQYDEQQHINPEPNYGTQNYNSQIASNAGHKNNNQNSKSPQGLKPESGLDNYNSQESGLKFDSPTKSGTSSGNHNYKGPQTFDGKPYNAQKPSNGNNKQKVNTQKPEKNSNNQNFNNEQFISAYSNENLESQKKEPAFTNENDYAQNFQPNNVKQDFNYQPLQTNYAQSPQTEYDNPKSMLQRPQSNYDNRNFNPLRPQQNYDYGNFNAQKPQSNNEKFNGQKPQIFSNNPNSNEQESEPEYNNENFNNRVPQTNYQNHDGQKLQNPDGIENFNSQNPQSNNQNFNAQKPELPYGSQNLNFDTPQVNYNNPNSNAQKPESYGIESFNSKPPQSSYEEQDFNAQNAESAKSPQNFKTQQPEYNNENQFLANAKPNFFNQENPMLPFEDENFNSQKQQYDYDEQNFNNQKPSYPYDSQDFNPQKQQFNYENSNFNPQIPSSPYENQHFNPQKQQYDYKNPNFNNQKLESGYKNPNSNNHKLEPGYKNPNFNNQKIESGYKNPNTNNQKLESGYKNPYFNTQTPLSPHGGQSFAAENPNNYENDNFYAQEAPMNFNEEEFFNPSSGYTNQDRPLNFNNQNSQKPYFNYDKPSFPAQKPQQPYDPASSIKQQPQRPKPTYNNQQYTPRPGSKYNNENDVKGVKNHNNGYKEPNPIRHKPSDQNGVKNHNTGYKGPNSTRPKPNAFANSIKGGGTKPLNFDGLEENDAATNPATTQMPESGKSTTTAYLATGYEAETHNTAFTTMGYDNNDDQANTAVFDNSQYTGQTRPNVFNSTYNNGAGYPSSTILPFAGGQNAQNTFSASDPQKTNPVNSVIYHSHLVMGLSTENFGTQYTNQAEKSFATNSRTPAGFFYDGRTHNVNFNIGNKVYDNSNFDSPSVTMVPSNKGKPGRGKEKPNLFSGDSTTPAGMTENYAGTDSTGYKTNEYHDNGGHGTIRYNNGEVASKIPENDIDDYRTSPYTRLPNSFIINAGGGKNEQSTLQQFNADDFPEGTYTKTGFTKTGPTKTGITTAQVGGSGSYVIGTRNPRPKPNPQFIGEHAFSGNFETTAPVDETTSSFYAKETSPSSDNKETKNVGTSKGYSYPKPSSGGLTKSGITSYNSFDATTPISSMRAQLFDDENSVTMKNEEPFDGDFGTTLAPVGFTTGQLENFKTTVHQATKTPQSKITVRPIVDTGYKTVISTTPIPAVFETQRVTDRPGDSSTQPRTYLNFGVSFDDGNDYTSTTLGLTEADFNEASTDLNKSNFGDKVNEIPRTRTYQQFTSNVKQLNQNRNRINIPSQNDYNIYVYNKNLESMQKESLRNNQANSFRSTLNNPQQIYLSSSPAPVQRLVFGKPLISAEFRPLPSRNLYKEATPFSLNQGLFVGNKISNKENNNPAMKDRLPTSFVRQYRPLVGSDVVTSIGGTPFNNQILRQNPANQKNLRVISEFDINSRVTTAAPEVTTYMGDYSRKRDNLQNKKVIVKLSDLHPLILEKLEAECSCKADPFAVFRGTKRVRLPINSQNRGKVDLANYDESDIYIDVDSDKDDEFLKNIPPSQLIKHPKATSRENQRKKNVPSKTTHSPKPFSKAQSNQLKSPVSKNNQAELRFRTPNHPLSIIKVDTDKVSATIESRSRTGKALLDRYPVSANDLADQYYADYKNLYAENDVETQRNTLECLRPGLFRHPQSCNKFYACHWDSWKKRFTLHTFNCPVHLAFDSSVGACNYPSKGPACQENKLLV